ncbi:MAG: hypothetical protein IPK32_23345 [Verrucomicrobiaceae bacterium]|nr:hypothetical protein [Verrucomicrobiaceae bacterium]
MMRSSVIRMVMQRSLENQAAKHQLALDALNAEHAQTVAAMRQDERKRLTAAAREFSSIFEGNQATLGYINALEDKVKSGQQLSKAEVERLTVITTGLGYLKKQYQKPMEEFKEPQDCFEAQAAKVVEKPKGASSNASSAKATARQKRNTSAIRVQSRPSSRRRACFHRFYQGAEVDGRCEPGCRCADQKLRGLHRR